MNLMECRVSVAMASYNGAPDIALQIESILKNLEEYDELVISDDGSTDNTVEIIKRYAKDDRRIRLVKGPGNGVKENFTNAMKNCRGKYIFLSDQDDIWFDDKVKKVVPLLKKHDLVVHDCIVTASSISQVIKPSFFKYRNSGSGLIKNIYKNTYIGCCMAFSRRLMINAIPIPSKIEMHDQWIGVLNDILYKNTYFLNEPLIYYRRHGTNVSSFKHYPFFKMLYNRLILIIEIIKMRKKR